MSSKRKTNISTLSAVQLIEMLDEDYRPYCIEPGESEIEAHRRSAKRELIDSLLKRLQREDGTRPTKISV